MKHMFLESSRGVALCACCCERMSSSAGGSKPLVFHRSFKEKGMLSQVISSRVRFMLRDILELRKSKWVPRRQKDEAKKISEIHAAAHAELGMMPAAMMPGLAPLPVQARAGVPGMGQDVELFPAFKTDGGPHIIPPPHPPPHPPPPPGQFWHAVVHHAPRN